MTQGGDEVRSENTTFQPNPLNPRNVENRKYDIWNRHTHFIFYKISDNAKYLMEIRFLNYTHFNL